MRSHVYAIYIHMHIRYIYVYLLVLLLVVYWFSCCLVTKMVHLFVSLTACLFSCIYDWLFVCLLIAIFFALLIFDSLVYLFISFFVSFDQSWVAFARTNKTTTYIYIYNCQSFPKDETCFCHQVNWSVVAIVPGSSAAKCSKATSRAAGAPHSHGRCGVLPRRP